MKLSEMNTVQLANTLCRLAPPVGRLTSEATVIDVMKGVKAKESEPLAAYVGRIAASVIPVALGVCRDDTLEIIAALSGKSLDQVKAQKGLQTIKDAMDAFSDEDVRSFFKSSSDSAQSAPLA